MWLSIVNKVLTWEVLQWRLGTNMEYVFYIDKMKNQYNICSSNAQIYKTGMVRSGEVHKSEE